MKLMINQRLQRIREDYHPASCLIGESRKGVLSVRVLIEFMNSYHVRDLERLSSPKDRDLDESLLKWLKVQRKPTSKETKSENSRLYNTEDFKEHFKKAFSVRNFADDDGKSSDEGEFGKLPAVACSLDDAVQPGKLWHNLEKDDVMPDRLERRIWNIGRLDVEDRWRLYRLWRSRLKTKCLGTINKCVEIYENEKEKLEEVTQTEDYEILRKARVIGMTTTCAAKHRQLLQRIRPKLVLIEEAAEVLEAHIITSLTFECEHAILIGDHQQLRPNTTTYKLAKDYKLNISLFERMVNSGIPSERLSVQHRMRPEIASLMTHFYNDLQNHSSVENHEDIKGIKQNVFFLDHSHPEDDSDDSQSHFNEYEAEFLIVFCRYLMQQGYEPSQMTILTPYLGQMFAIRDRMSETNEDKLLQIRSSTVDNFQGEENDIILLSLVRSNTEGHVGFLNDVNRACVALSRARKGFYCLGNFQLLAKKSDIWRAVISDVTSKGQIGDALPLVCHSHKEEVTVKEPKDFKDKVPSGGCLRLCEYRLTCGHSCNKFCHPDDPRHLDFRCLEPCARTIPGCTEGHQCSNTCGVMCEEKCAAVVEKILPCGHNRNVRCSEDLNKVLCKERCEKTLSCTHQCQSYCGMIPCTKDCKELVKRLDWPCGHEVTIACSANPVDCPVPCKDPLDCFHGCSGTCGECRQGRVHKYCSKKCDRVLVCSHKCTSTSNRSCNTDACPPCSKPCQTVCSHSKCKNECGDLCTPCMYPCDWKCSHFECGKTCGDMCDRPRCNEPCRNLLDCGHECRGLCSESCICVTCDPVEDVFGTGEIEDKDTRFFRLPDCRHILQVTGRSLDYWMDVQNYDTENGESGEAIQLKGCPLCKTPVRKSRRYNNVIKEQLKDIETVKKNILGDQETLKVRKTALMEKLSVLNQRYNDEKTKTECKDLEHRVKRAVHHDLAATENKIILVERFYQLNLKLTQHIAQQSGQFDVLTRGEVLMIKTEVEYFRKKRIMHCGSGREARDINLEVSRLGLRFEVCSLRTDVKHAERELNPEHQKLLEEISDVISKGTRLDDPEVDNYLRKLSETRVKYQITSLTPEERKEIVQAMGLRKGQWFKCKQGHIYAIGDCGGAMERGTCPECHDVIGGQSHKLVAGNELAPEMDGAQHAAWSEQANLGNYILLDEM